MDTDLPGLDKLLTEGHLYQYNEDWKLSFQIES